MIGVIGVGGNQDRGDIRVRNGEQTKTESFLKLHVL